MALLLPIDWPEPFGLVMIEAMACGTPVIAFNRGSVPEVIDDGVSGFIVEDETGALAAIKRLEQLPARARPPAVRGPLHGPPNGGGLLAVYRGLGVDRRSELRPSGDNPSPRPSPASKRERESYSGCSL